MTPLSIGERGSSWTQLLTGPAGELPKSLGIGQQKGWSVGKLGSLCWNVTIRYMELNPAKQTWLQDTKTAEDLYAGWSVWDHQPMPSDFPAFPGTLCTMMEAQCREDTATGATSEWRATLGVRATPLGVRTSCWNGRWPGQAWCL